jgi:hypothetical protein
MTDIVEQVATEIADIPGDPSSLEIARIAIEAYQRAIWEPTMKMVPELRRYRASQITSQIMHILGKYICAHADRNLHRDASRDLMETFYESGAELIPDADRAAVGLTPRGPYGLTAQELAILENRRIEIMLRPLPMMIPIGDK